MTTLALFTRRGISAILMGGLMVTPIAACAHRPHTARAVTERGGTGRDPRSAKRAEGSTQSATAEDLKNVKAARFEDLVSGRFRGVHVLRAPDGGVFIRIRGASRLSDEQEPLYIVDGVPVTITPGRGLDWLNPADIARIDVLKDAAETTMYGVRGANGVIVIRTKLST